MNDSMNETGADEMFQPCDAALLVLYGEEDAFGHDPDSCGPCRRLVDQATEVLDAYREHVAPTAAASGLPTDLREPPPALRQSLPRPPARIGTFAAAAGLILLAASGTMAKIPTAITPNAPCQPKDCISPWVAGSITT